MATASGQVTNAVFGFTSMLINLLRDNRPDGVIAAFDRPEPTFRHEAIDEYKANRTAAPDILRQQMGLVRQVVETLGVVTLDLAGLRGRRHHRHASPSRPRRRSARSIIVTGDRDEYQLVEDPHIKVLYNRRGVSRLRALRRGRHPGAHRRHARRSIPSTPPCGAIRPTTSRACPAWGRRRRPS